MNILVAGLTVTIFGGLPERHYSVCYRVTAVEPVAQEML